MILPVLLLAFASLKLYLKDGGYHTVREYEVKQDRVRYYSTERGDWEEIPLDLVDLARTKKEVSERETEVRAEKEANAAEDKAEREMRREVARVPKEAGAYWIRGDEMAALKQAESKVVTDKKRSVLKAITPIPLVAGKATVEVDGSHSAFIIGEDRPEFYFRLSAQERFGIVRLNPTKSARIVEKWNIIPVSKEIISEQDIVEIFRHQVGEELYKIWPQKPLAAGEYAVIQFTEGKGNTQVWDFRVDPSSKP